MGQFQQVDIYPLFDFPDESIPFQWNGGKHLFVSVQSIADKIPKTVWKKLHFSDFIDHNQFYI